MERTKTNSIIVGMLVLGLSVSGLVHGKTPKPKTTPAKTINPVATATPTKSSSPAVSEGSPTTVASPVNAATPVAVAAPVETMVSVFIAGDSTASNYEANRAPRMGWGQVLPDFFDTKRVTINNYAVSGRSSKSYIDEGYLETIVKCIKANDYLLIQFGHNDQKPEAARHTEPFTTYKACLTQYIKVAQEKGANPVLLTPVHRYKFDGAGKVVSSHGDYPKAVVELGKELNVPVIDVAEKSRQIFETLGPERTFKLFLNLQAGESSNYPTGNSDNTHFTDVGAREIAKLVVEGLKEAQLPLVKYLKAEAGGK